MGGVLSSGAIGAALPGGGGRGFIANALMGQTPAGRAAASDLERERAEEERKREIERRKTAAQSMLLQNPGLLSAPQRLSDRESQLDLGRTNAPLSGQTFPIDSRMEILPIPGMNDGENLVTAPIAGSPILAPGQERGVQQRVADIQSLGRENQLFRELRQAAAPEKARAELLRQIYPDPPSKDNFITVDGRLYDITKDKFVTEAQEKALTGGALDEEQIARSMRLSGYTEEQIARLAPGIAGGLNIFDSFSGTVRSMAGDIERPGGRPSGGAPRTSAVAAPTPAETATPAGPPLPPIPDITDASGVQGYLTGLTNTVFDAVGAEPFSPKNMAATTALENLQSNWQIAMMRAIPGRTAVDIREMTKSMFPSPNEITTGPSKVQSKFEANSRFLKNEIQRINRDVLSRKGRRTYSRSQLADAELNRDELKGLASMMDELVGQFDKKDQATQEVPTVLNQADRDLLNKYTGGVSSP